MNESQTSVEKPTFGRVDVRNYGSGWKEPAVLLELVKDQVAVPQYIFGKEGEEGFSVFDAIRRLLDLREANLVHYRFVCTKLLEFRGGAMASSLLSKAEVIVEYKGNKFEGACSEQNNEYLALAEAFLDALWKARL